ncbi:FAD-dependent oxidoreductase [Gordonia pseudamarae]|jgi:phytoene dehydrogenase-like protein|uniref:Pyridine nucleotide-disulfide oxidoreductase domain-containing protein 2 n=1 Tax=Gordonia pseudamarae TaxID=2831662 RepID=A0ABX6ILJ7_9ACTN|nr:MULTISPECIES: NAD(P)/FAD-dependent oxidoreductase [Gordonia]MBD0023181.1 NAD(P)/FAD-dependent oxidoreductase [Gordonia sp. (in: high G+C Gram-positive bacteria)]QHN27107.1 FAD-dependent oxidoreductase [Gordonia pseudamarae]QHN35996.1 FAD-dependent oxidoreductase [Gordonia pseudamarae]
MITDIDLSAYELPAETDYLIIGAGHNGLTAGSYLARAGHQVTVVETSPTLGGMTSTNAIMPKAPGHRFNEGAIQATGIYNVSGVTEDLELHKYGLTLIPVDPAHVQLAPDGSSLAIWTDASRTADELRRFSRKDADTWLELANALAPAMDIAVAYMKTHPLRPWSKELGKAILRASAHPKRLAPLIHFATASHTEFLEETFETELPKGALAAMAAFSQMRLDMTAWSMIYLGIVQKVPNAMPIGGTGALPAAIARYLLAHGGTIHPNSPVAEIVLSHGRATAVKLVDGRTVRARKGIISACNPVVTFGELLPEDALDHRLATRAKDIPIRKTHATSLKINVALEGEVSMERHEQWRGDGLDIRKHLVSWHTLEEQDAAWNAVVRGEWPEIVPNSCSMIPSAVDPTQAPQGQSTFWFWSGVIPVTPREPWDDVRDKIGDAVLRDCALYYKGLDSLEIDRRVLGGPDIEERFNAPAGNVYHVDPLITRFGPLKPAPGLGGYSLPIDGLFLSGAGTHPVGGVCALPGKLAAEEALRVEAKRR